MTAKHKLNVNKLQVESFEAQLPETASRGTVRGNQLSVDTCYDATCRGYGTCGIYPCKPVP
jgi:hypothetical protein